MTHSFLVLCVLFAIPGALIWWRRPDLRPVIHVVSLCSLPFALTESLFYPTYWRPKFLWDLVEVFGFGIEDFLFVVGLAAFSSTAYAAAFGQRYVPLERDPPSASARATALLLATFVLVGAAALLAVPMIYAAPIIMFAVSLACWTQRPDLAGPSILGSLVTTIVYSGLCLIFAALLPGIFTLDWNTDAFLNVFVLGIPVEEILYAAASGMIATIFYPFVSSTAFAPGTPPRGSHHR